MTDDTPEILITEVRQIDRGVRVVQTETSGQYIFADLEYHAERADYVYGEIPETEDTPVVYVDAKSSYYVDPQPSPAPDTVRETVEATQDVTVVHPDRVEGGWETWGGRPEFDESQTYLRFEADDR